MVECECRANVCHQKNRSSHASEQNEWKNAVKDKFVANRPSAGRGVNIPTDKAKQSRDIQNNI
jgi:hypothetical protein